MGVVVGLVVVWTECCYIGVLSLLLIIHGSLIAWLFVMDMYEPASNLRKTQPLRLGRQTRRSSSTLVKITGKNEYPRSIRVRY